MPASGLIYRALQKPNFSDSLKCNNFIEEAISIIEQQSLLWKDLALDPSHEDETWGTLALNSLIYHRNIRALPFVTICIFLF